MTLLVNLAVFGVFCAPFIAGGLGWAYLKHPTRMLDRRMRKLQASIQKAIASGDFTKAHALSYAYTGLRRSVDPSAPEYRPPEMVEFYEAMTRPHLDPGREEGK